MNVQPWIGHSKNVRSQISQSMKVQPQISQSTKVQPLISQSMKVQPQISQSTKVQPLISQPMKVQSQISQPTKVRSQISQLMNIWQRNGSSEPKEIVDLSMQQHRYTQGATTTCKYHTHCISLMHQTLMKGLVTHLIIFMAVALLEGKL